MMKFIDKLMICLLFATLAQYTLNIHDLSLNSLFFRVAFGGFHLILWCAFERADKDKEVSEGK